MDAGKAVIAMLEARNRLARAAKLARQRPGDPRAREQAHQANTVYRELSTRIVPQALRSMPIPAKQITVLQMVPGRPELTESVTVALSPEVRVHVPKKERRRRVLRWLEEQDHWDLARELRGPFTRKQEQVACWRQRLGRFAREQIDLGEELPWDLLSVRVRWTARFLREDSAG